MRLRNAHVRFCQRDGRRERKDWWVLDFMVREKKRLHMCMQD